MKNILVVLMGLMLLVAIGCTVPERSSVPAPVAPSSQPEVPAEKPADLPAPPVEAPEKAAEKEEAKAEAKPAVETNVVKLVQQDGYVNFENSDVKVKKGSSVTFRYAGEKGRTVVNVYDANNKPVDKLTGSGYLVSGQEWTTPPLDKEGVYSMKILYGKKFDGKITVE